MSAVELGPISHGGERDYVALCTICGQRASLTAYECARCSGPLILDMAAVRASNECPGGGKALGIWRHAHLLPRTMAAVSLGEGTTPLLPFIDVDNPGVELWLKAEHLNPTLSFKDRAMALAASIAVDRRVTGLVLASTGNAAASAAPYAAAAGLPCQVFYGSTSGAARKLAVAHAFGAQTTEVKGDYSTAYAAVVAAEEDGWMNVTTTYRNPVLAEAYRTTAAEIIEDLGDAPDVVIVPVGAGPLLHGLRQGFRDAIDAGQIDREPRMVGVQAAACAPLAAAWTSDDWLTSLRQPMDVGVTSATAIADALRGYEEQGLITLNDVRDSGGALVAVSEETILAAQGRLRAAGHLVEAASATALAGLTTAACKVRLVPGSRVVLMMTGHGAKERLASAA